MALVRSIQGGWQGTITGRNYYPPRETQQSAEAQERKHRRERPLELPKGIKEGSTEWHIYKAQEEALTNQQRSDVSDTIAAYHEFCALHPEIPKNDANANMLSEYLYMKGVQFVDYNGARVPLATSVEQWEEALEHKLAVGHMQVDPSVQDAQQRLEAQKRATERVRARENPPVEDDTPWEEFHKRAAGVL